MIGNLTPRQALEMVEFISRRAFINCGNLHHSSKERHAISSPCPVEQKLHLCIDELTRYLKSQCEVAKKNKQSNKQE